jgi:oxalate decarboxylase
MKLQSLASGLLFASTTFGAVIKRAEFKNGQPIDGKGKGAPILGTHNLRFNVFSVKELAEDFALLHLSFA